MLAVHCGGALRGIALAALPAPWLTTGNTMKRAILFVAIAQLGSGMSAALEGPLAEAIGWSGY